MTLEVKYALLPNILKSSPVIVVFDVIVVSVTSKVEFELTYTLELLRINWRAVNAN